MAPTLLSKRIASIDIVRGVAMLLMAIDHVRVYSAVPAYGATPGVFFTRWVTHFCAPAFVFLAGTALFLYASAIGAVDSPKPGARPKLVRFLITRGLWLVFLELTVLRVAWTFNFDFAHYLLAGVIWMIGCCMILLAAFVYLPAKVSGAIGVAVIALHNLMDLFSKPLEAAFGQAGPNSLLRILYFGGKASLGASMPPLTILYVLVPWIGVMLAGYAFGAVMRLTTERRRSISLLLGFSLVVLFIALRLLGLYGDPQPWAEAMSWLPKPLAFLATTKYPTSLQFLAMTLGPMFLLLAAAESFRGKAAGILAMFGRVPLFYYLLHVPLIHLAACIVSLVRTGAADPWLFANHPMSPGRAPEGYLWSLPLLYLVWALCVLALYFPCCWFARLKDERRSVWLSYL